jgi:hypothetical protein
MRLLVSAGFSWVIDLVKKIGPSEIIPLSPEVGAIFASAEMSVKPLSIANDRDATVETGRYLRQVCSVIDDSPAAMLTLKMLGSLAMMTIALDEAKPDCVLLHNDVEPGPMLAALWAKARGVPCFHVPHAIYLDHPWRGGRGEDVHDLVTSSHIAAASPYQADWYQQVDHEAEIQVTGAPRWDKLITDLRVRRNEARDALGLTDQDFAVMYATSWGQATSQVGKKIDPFAFFMTFLESAKRWQLPRLALLIKLHPNQQDGKRYADALAASGLRGLVTATHLPILLRAADRLISFGVSNICFEGWFAGLTPITHGIPAPWNGSWAPNEIDVSLVLEPKPVDLAYFSGAPDGKAGDRVANWVRQHNCHG